MLASLILENSFSFVVPGCGKLYSPAMLLADIMVVYSVY
jgi:hypothetical protein